jgi:hypothetical protein
MEMQFMSDDFEAIILATLEERRLFLNAPCWATLELVATLSANFGEQQPCTHYRGSRLKVIFLDIIRIQAD